MTNLHLAILSTVLTLAILGYLWHVKSHISAVLTAISFFAQQNERSLRSHVVDEMDQIQTHTTSLYANTLHRIDMGEKAVISFVTEHADTLRKHAEDLRNHAKELSDRAEVQASPPRQAVTRN